MSVIDRETGSWLGRYDLIAELPREDVADVYLAASVAPGGYIKLAVLRVLRPTLAGGDSLAPQFLSAARVGARLHHANILETYEVAQEGGETLVAREYLEGQTLARVVARIGAGDFGRAMWLRVLVDVLAGLHHAHEALDDGGAPLRLAHLQLTTAQVFVTYDGQVKVLDFGRVEPQDASERGRALGRRVASVAPEQARGEPADRRADVFAVGVMLWEAATRVPLWGERDERAILSEVSAGRIPSLRQVDPAVPLPLADIVDRALAADPEDRYSTAMHMQTDLEGFLRASDDSPAPREIGRIVAHAFLEERLRMATIVDEQLRRLRAKSLGGDGSDGGGHVSLLRLETATSPGGPASPDGMLAVPTSPRPFQPAGAPAAGQESEAQRSPERAPLPARRIAWIAGGAALLLVLAALVVASAR